MSKLVSGYLWAWTNYEAGSKSVASLKKFYPDADIFINVDYDGDVENYTRVCNENQYTFSRNNFQLGYCGNFGDRDYGRDCWPIESSVEWMNGLYNACLKTDSEYIFLFEEDDFVLKPLSIFENKFSMAIHPTNPSPIGRYRANHIPNEFLFFINENNGNAESPGYAAGGGTIFNRIEMIKSWEKTKPILIENYDYLKSINKIIGWQDYLMQFVMQLGGYEIIQNRNLCEYWEVKEKWNEFEIVTGMKNIELINKI
jgi:hypothetical protein